MWNQFDEDWREKNNVETDNLPGIYSKRIFSVHQVESSIQRQHFHIMKEGCHICPDIAESNYCRSIRQTNNNEN